ncbi:E3 ubiquitin-protein ligase ATL41-like [Ananas comosus]|uniref:RING-type E3 ubiquitin transferase n=1 Tax=Ananas comosus TaxID=4615 RepID=A0A199UDZ2_ANACO|nr:E3 ubiquitin-protein ligase ATL41-like [Ananas comosus]OAY63087.1 E3 ubiquitin-protein ligase ATL41 [Ananas comosus]
MSNANNVDLQAPADPYEWLASDETKRPTTYSLNIRILTTAVLSLAFVLAFLLFLHLYIRYVLRRTHRSHHRQSTTAIATTTTADTTTLRIGFAAAAANNNNNNNNEPAKRPGLDPSAIAALPSFSYAKREAVDCAVCLSAVEAGETVRRLPGCGHVFHVRCVDAWLETNSSCPVCRAGVEPPPPVSVSADVAVAGDAAVGGKEEAVGSVSARLSTSLRRMLSRERSGRGAAVAAAGEIAVEDLERQQ